MKPIILILLLLSVFVSCRFEKTNRIIRKETRRFHKEPVLITSKKDSVVRNVTLYYNNHFSFAEGRIPRKKETEAYYAGEYNQVNDTIFLNYYKNYAPTYLESYFILDLANEIIILPFKDSPRRLHLNILSGSANFKVKQ
jgi:hypothetical protein